MGWLDRRHAWVLLFGVFALGCRAEEGGASDEYTTIRSALVSSFSLPLFVGSNPTDIALGASHLLQINDRTHVEDPAGIVALVSNLGVSVPDTQLGTALGVSAQVGTILSRPRVNLRSNATVFGSVYQGVDVPPTLQTGVTITGISKSGIKYVSDATWTKAVTWPATFNPTPNLEPGQQPTTVVLAPGAYHTLDVKNGRTLRLVTGEYFLDGLIIGSGAGLQIFAGDGPVFVYILDGGFIFRGTMPTGVNTPTAPTPSLTIMTAGSATLETAFSGVVIAPNGRVDLKGNSAVHHGAFFGKDVTLYETNRVIHYRDPFSFRGLGQDTVLGDRASVTGGSIRILVADPTDEAFQAEAVAAISRNSVNSVVTVGYNDTTTSPTNPTIVYPGDSNHLDARDATTRLLRKGTSLMGFSFSTDGGHTFTYGGRVAPPPGWSIIWGDSAIGKVNIDDPNVYYAQISGTTVKFESVWDPQQQAIVSSGQNVVGALDGYCIARSNTRGLTFSSVVCLADVFQDGSALAVGLDTSNRRKVYVTGSATRVWRVDGDSMTVEPGPLPDPFTQHEGHPRMRIFGGVLYILQKHGLNIHANRLNAAGNATTWMGQTTLATDAFGEASNLGSGIAVQNGPPFSFDFGPDANGQTKFRMMYSFFDGPFGGPNRTALRVVECALDLTACRTTGWSTVGQLGGEQNPSLRFSGGQWVATWRKDDPGSPTGLVRAVAGRLEISGSNETVNQRTLYQGVLPCFYDTPSFARWGEYDQLDGFGDGRFFAPYTVNGPGCRWQGTFTADAHVGGSVFGF